MEKSKIPPPLSKKELAMKKEVEDKVRLLLQRTELKGIAESAKVVVSIAQKAEPGSQKVVEQMMMMNADGSRAQSNISLPPS